MKKNYTQYDYTIGTHANRPDLAPIKWNPDSKDSINPHLLLCGGSGAGKTTKLKDIVLHLHETGKHIYMFDLKGDLLIKNYKNEKVGNYIEFTAWNSNYGINPFEFDTGVTEDELRLIIDSDSELTPEQRFKIQNSGSKVQVERLIEIIRKNFLPTMGTHQKDNLFNLLSDTYLSKGIVYNDIKTWLNELPSLEDTLKMIEMLKSYVGQGSQKLDSISSDYIKEIRHIIKKLKILKLQEEKESCAEKPSYDEVSTEESEASDEVSTEESEASDEVSTEEVEILEEAEPTTKEKIEKLEDELKEATLSYSNDCIQNFKVEDIAISGSKEWFLDRSIDIDKYLTKDNFRAVIKLESYIRALVESEIFHSKKPPVKAGLNIINISGLEVNIQRFLVDIMLGKVFKACKIRGDYAKLENKSRGEKCDTFFVIDESKLVAGNSREKNDPFSYLNRIATEARSNGLGIIVASQSAEHFPPEFLKNFNMQIILNTGIADFDTVRKSFGIDKMLLEYTQNGWGNALVKQGRNFVKTKFKDIPIY